MDSKITYAGASLGYRLPVAGILGSRGNKESAASCVPCEARVLLHPCLRVYTDGCYVVEVGVSTYLFLFLSPQQYVYSVPHRADRMLVCLHRETKGQTDRQTEAGEGGGGGGQMSGGKGEGEERAREGGC